MPNWLQNVINNTLGSNTTHITNAYSASYYVWLILHSETLSQREIRIILSTKESVKDIIKQKTEIYKLQFGEEFLKRRTTNEEYLSVVTPDYRVTCINLVMPANRSYIVADSLRVIESVYGGSIWEDNQGRDHRPEKHLVVRARDAEKQLQSKIGETNIDDCGEMPDTSHQSVTKIIKIHYGDKIKTSLIDGDVQMCGPLNISDSSVTGKHVGS